MAPLADTATDSLSFYLSEIGKNPVLTREQEQALFKRLERGDESAREEILACNLRFVVKVAAQFRGRGLPLADLVQEGNVGLLEVIEKFDWRRGFRFSTYAAFWIRQAIQRALVRTGSFVRLPSRKARLLGHVTQVIEDHRAEHRRDPSVDEMAEAMEMDAESLGAILRWRESVLSLDAPMDDDGGALMEIVAGGDESDPLQSLMEEERTRQVTQALDRLSDKERAILRLRYGFETGKSLSLRRTSTRIGLSQEGVRRLEHVALNKLRRRSRRGELAALL
ncbi:MAG: sigma-70 family RNA polymerase sigma factor [Candidatus Sumerlaeia bacterium]|nr:sigma-70 family RNA polymerase sigma factor [Candidatus Sumerlaeia bacterium]